MMARPVPVVVGALVLVGLPTAFLFLRSQGGLLGEFTIAEDARVLGSTLNELPGEPSVGVVVAGGIRMTYEGEILDLLGLNWVAMAHAPDDEVRHGYANHQSFNTNVFWQSPPDIFVPYTGECPSAWQPMPGFYNRVTDRVSEEAAFAERYDLYCHKGAVLYVARDYVERVKAAGHAFDFHRVERDG